jgi:hypothetical protein
MDRRIFCWTTLALLAGGGVTAQTLSFDPVNPKPGDTVKFTVTLSDCFTSLHAGGVTPPGPGNGAIQLTLTHGCACVTGPRVTLDAEAGPLAFGTYGVQLIQEFRLNGALCSPPELLSTTALTVSRNGEVVGLRPEPPQPVAGQPLTVGFDSFCPLVFKEPRIEPSGSETLIILDQDPESPQPAAPCFTVPTYQVRFPVGGLSAGTARLRVRMGDSSAALEEVAESVFVAEPPSGSSLLLRQGRFRVWADWSAPGFGEGSAQAVPLTDESGYFTFFSPSNVELMVKVLNGCPVNQRYWVFMAGLTNQAVTVHVEDTLLGRLVTYSNPAGRPFQPVQDTTSFATCP